MEHSMYLTFAFLLTINSWSRKKTVSISISLTWNTVRQRPYLLFQVNSVDSWNRHRIEGYGFLRLPLEPGYHKGIEVDTWRPRGSLATEIHSFFLGGSVRVLKLEELVRTRYLD